MIPMNDPLMMLADAARRGQNPMQVLDRLATQDPRMAQAKQMLRGKSPQQLEQMARNMARERGVNIDELVRSLGLR